MRSRRRERRHAGEVAGVDGRRRGRAGRRLGRRDALAHGLGGGGADGLEDGGRVRQGGGDGALAASVPGEVDDAGGGLGREPRRRAGVPGFDPAHEARPPARQLVATGRRDRALQLDHPHVRGEPRQDVLALGREPALVVAEDDGAAADHAEADLALGRPLARRRPARVRAEPDVVEEVVGQHDGRRRPRLQSAAAMRVRVMLPVCVTGVVPSEATVWILTAPQPSRPPTSTASPAAKSYKA
jgi:hypothetical protein